MKSRVILFTLVAVLFPALQSWSQQPSAALRIRGVLAKKNGSPLKGRTVAAYPLDAKGSAISVLSLDAQGKLGNWNPSAQTDAAGSFVISFPRIASIGEDPVIEVCLAVNPPPVGSPKVMVVSIHHVDPNKAAEKALKVLEVKNDKLTILRKGSEVLRVRMDEKADEIDLGQIVVN